jgi:hypothetical protein
MDNQQERTHLKKYLLGWLAGFIDADGSLMLAKQTYKRGEISCHYRPMIVFHNTNMQTMKKIEDILDHYKLPYYCQDRYYKTQVGKGEKQRRSYRRITIYGFKRCKKFFDVTEIKLIGKKDQQDLMLKYIDYRFSRPRGEKLTQVDIDYYEQMKQLNTLSKGELSPETTRQKGSKVIKNYKP